MKWNQDPTYVSETDDYPSRTDINRLQRFFVAVFPFLFVVFSLGGGVPFSPALPCTRSECVALAHPSLPLSTRPLSPLCLARAPQPAMAPFMRGPPNHYAPFMRGPPNHDPTIPPPSATLVGGTATGAKGMKKTLTPLNDRLPSLIIRPSQPLFWG